MTARAMNLLTINAQAALNPTSKQAAAERVLAINAREFASLNPAQQMLALADAYSNSARDGEAYAAASTLIGKRNTEMIPTIEKGSAAIRKMGEEMGIMSDKTVQSLENAHKRFAIAGNAWTIIIGSIVGWLQDLDVEASKSANSMSQWYTSIGGAIDQALVGNMSAAWQMLKQTNKTLQEQNDEVDKATHLYEAMGIAEHKAASEGVAAVLGKNVPTKEGMTAKGPENEFGDLNAYYDKLGEVEDKETAAYQAGLTKETLLAQKVRERADLQGELSTEVENESDQTDRALQLRGQIADLDKEIVPLENARSDAAAKWLEDATKANDQEKANLAVMALRAQGRDEEADALKTQLDYQEKINAAYADGNTLLAETLGKEQALAAQVAQQEINKKVSEQGMQKTSPLTGFGPYYGGGGGYVPDYMAQGLATDPLTGKVDQDALMRYTARSQYAALTGKDDFNFEDRAYSQFTLGKAADRELKRQGDMLEQQKQSAVEYLQGVMSGRIHPASQQDYLQHYSAAYGAPLFSAGNLKNVFGTSVANIGGGTSGLSQVQQQLDLLSAQLARLTNIDKNLTPTPGY
jgi:hypothetical protein